MDLKGLLEIGTWSGEIVDEKIKWKGDTIDLKIKKELSPADFEFIYAHPKAGDDSHMARRVSRSITIDGEAIGYETAKRFKPALLSLMCEAINRVQNALGEAKKS